MQFVFEMPNKPQRKHQSTVWGCLSVSLSFYLFISWSRFWMSALPYRDEDHTLVDNVVMSVRLRTPMWHEYASRYEKCSRSLVWSMTAHRHPILSLTKHTHAHSDMCTRTTGLWYAWEQKILLAGLIFIVNFILTYSPQPLCLSLP